MQTPATQSNPAAHAFAHVPQCEGSLVRSTQLAPHCVLPPLQPDVVHAPFEHASPFGHLFPQAPQLKLSMSVFVQMPLHEV